MFSGGAATLLASLTLFPVVWCGLVEFLKESCKFNQPESMKYISVLLNLILLHFKPVFKLITAHYSPRRDVLRRHGSIVSLINVVSHRLGLPNEVLCGTAYERSKFQIYCLHNYFNRGIDLAPSFRDHRDTKLCHLCYKQTNYFNLHVCPSV